jgi:dynein heavy chain
VKSANKLVYGTLDIYKKVMEELLPTPSKSHYLFNLRDFSKVILGITMSDKENLRT